MAFNLQKVLRALLFSSSQALSIKDVQDIFARFHEQAPAATAAAAAAAAEVEANAEISPLTVPVADVVADADADADAIAAADADAETNAEREPEPEPDPEAPSLKPAGLVFAKATQATQSVQAEEPVHDAQPEESAEPAQAEEREEPAQADQPADVDAATDAPAPADDSGLQTGEPAEVPVQSPADTDAELYQNVPSLITAAQIREAMDTIAAELRAANDIYILVEGPTGYRLMTHPRYARWIRIMRDEPPPVKLSQSSLETLAVVAYRQPVTRGEIESIRGVSADAGLGKLMERELVYITGRADLPGRPLQYGTTDKFLEFVGVKSLIELPASDVLSPRQIDAWLQNSTKITPPSDAEMGLPLEEGEGESPNLASVSVDHTATPFEAEAPTGAPTEEAQERDQAERAERTDRTEQTEQSDQPDQTEQPPASDALALAPDAPASDASASDADTPASDAPAKPE